MSIIKKVYKAKEVREGAGVLVNRVFGYYETPDFDPFLMLDYFETKEDKESPGFPWHPHKGIETISYFIRGSGLHEDNFGNKGMIGPGEVQWMSAGKGIYHQELAGPTPNGVQGFQFWLNLPQKEKLKDPDYKYIKQDEMKSFTGDGLAVKVIAGTYQDIIGPIDKSNLGVTMLHVSLQKDKKIELDRQIGKQGFIFVFEGQGTLNKEDVSQITAYTLNAGNLQVIASSDMEFIYAEGIPLKEPIAWRGPIVMNTDQEIVETFRDLRDGTFSK